MELVNLFYTNFYGGHVLMHRLNTVAAIWRMKNDWDDRWEELKPELYQIYHRVEKKLQINVNFKINPTGINTEQVAREKFEDHINIKHFIKSLELSVLRNQVKKVISLTFEWKKQSG